MSSVLEKLGAAAAVGALLFACSGSNVSVGDDDGGARPDAGSDGTTNPPECPATTPQGQTCTVAPGAGCKYAGCTYCNCSSGRWVCAAPGCAGRPSELRLTVQDASGALVADPKFSEGGRALSLSCARQANDAGVSDGGIACAEWSYFAQGHHEITVTAAGFAPKLVVVDIPSPKGECCPMGETVTRAVTLTP